MRQRFFENTIQSKYIKSLLFETPIPTCDCVSTGDFIISGFNYIYNKHIIQCTQTGYIGTDGKFNLLSVFNWGSYYPNFTEKLTSKFNYYDSETHEWLGNYLRSYNKCFHINLMPFYNCFSGRYTDNFHIVPNQVNISTKCNDGSDIKNISIDATKWASKISKSGTYIFVYSLPDDKWALSTLTVEKVLAGNIITCTRGSRIVKDKYEVYQDTFDGRLVNIIGEDITYLSCGNVKKSRFTAGSVLKKGSTITDGSFINNMSYQLLKDKNYINSANMLTSDMIVLKVETSTDVPTELNTGSLIASSSLIKKRSIVNGMSYLEDLTLVSSLKIITTSDLSDMLFYIPPQLDGLYILEYSYSNDIDLIEYGILYSFDPGGILHDHDSITITYSMSKGAVKTGSMTGFKTIILPIKYNQTYTIAVDSSSSIYVSPVICDQDSLVKVILEGTEFDLTDKLLSTGSLVSNYTNSSFINPFTYRVENKDDFSKATSSLSTCLMLYMYQNYLKLLILIPDTNDSSIVVLEGDYTSTKTNKIFSLESDNLSNEFFDEDSQKFESSDYINNLLLSKLSLLQLNDKVRYPFSDRLIEFLCNNVIDSSEYILHNVERVQNMSGLQDNQFVINDVWNEYIRSVLYKRYMKNDKVLKLDITGFVDKDMEYALLQGRVK